MSIIKCNNKDKTYRYKLSCRGDLLACSGCRYLYTHQGQHYTDDKIECTCPLDVKHGDKIEYILRKV